MKKLAKLLVLVLALATFLSVSAFASDFDHCADALNEMGLFQGTSNGYDLDRAPTRAEASAMLVRLLGKEAEAKELTYTAPFTDVLDWAKPYVQYLYDNGLTNGKTATTFGAKDRCTAQQYATFLMRALGYSEAASDFTYADALDFATQKGVVDAINCDPDNFLRDDVVAMSYTALSVAPKSGETDLLTKLVKEGAVADAKGYDELFANLRAYQAVANSDNTKGHMVMNINLAVTADKEKVADGTIKMDLNMDMDPKKPDSSKMAVTANVDMKVSADLVDDPSMAAINMDMNYYYTNGVLYLDLAGKKMQMPLSFENALDQFDVSFNESQNDPVCMIANLTAKKSGNTTVYTIDYAPDAINSILDMIYNMGLQDAGIEGLTLQLTNCEVTVTNGAMTGMKASMDMGTTVENIPLHIVADMDVTVDTKNVTVKLPNDLNTYASMYTEQAA